MNTGRRKYTTAELRWAGQRVRAAALVLATGALVAAAAPLHAGGRYQAIADTQEVAWAESTPVPTAASTAWRLIADGRRVAWTPPSTFSADSLGAAARSALAMLHADGYALARIDSARTEAAPDAATVTLYATRGPLVDVASFDVRGAQALDPAVLRRRLATREGRPLRPATLEDDVQRVLDAYDAAGYPFAEVAIADLRLVGAAERDDEMGWAVTLAIEEGLAPSFGRVELVGAQRTSPAYVERVAGLSRGAPLHDYDPAALVAALEATGLFTRVGTPVLTLDPDTTAVLRVPLQEDVPGVFDLVLGYLPSDGTGGSGLVGNGHLALRNLFGGGRTASLRLVRLPGRVSTLDARLSDPFVLGLPFTASLRFSGRQQDSTFSQQQGQASLGYRFGRDLEVFGMVSRTATQPGIGAEAVPRSSAWFGGLGLRYSSVDQPLNPRRGLVAETSVEQGRKRLAVVPSDTPATPSALRSVIRQERLHAMLRGFMPAAPRLVAVLGLDASVLLSDTYERSDLFRFGGATSLRGYDEERFLGRLVARGLAELRYRLDPTSFLFAFFDVGYIDRPALDTLRGRQVVKPGYGLGLQYRTPLGLVNASYAVSPEGGLAGGRVHVGLSVGL